TTTSLLSGMVGTAYSADLTANTEATTWVLASGSLPAGLMLSSSGHISGTPTMDGHFAFSVRASATGYVSGEKSLMIVVAPMGMNPPPPPPPPPPNMSDLQITLSTMLLVYTNADINRSLTAMGGTPPYTWSIVSGDLLPGLSLD